MKDNKEIVLAALHEMVEMSVEDYMNFCIMLRQYCPMEEQAKSEILIQLTLEIRKKKECNKHIFDTSLKKKFMALFKPFLNFGQVW